MYTQECRSRIQALGQWQVLEEEDDNGRYSGQIFDQEKREGRAPTLTDLVVNGWQKSLRIPI